MYLNDNKEGVINYMNGERKSKNGKLNKFFIFLKKNLSVKAIGVIFSIILVFIVGLGFGSRFFTSSKTTKLGFEDIGELATQEAYCSTVSNPEKSRTLFGIEIPFTQSKYIYSYDTVIKAGIDFTKVEWDVKGKKIIVKLPEIKVLSNEIKLDTFKVYHESESIFTPISLEESNESLNKLKQEAEKTAISNGLLDNARENAKVILTGFFGNVYDLEEYKIEFKEKK